MGARHRRGSGRAARITRIGVATATATAMAVTVAPPSEAPRPATYANVDLAAAIRVLPNHDQVPDLTGGAGTAIYDSSQAVADQLIRAIVNGISLTAFAQAAGLDPQSLVNTLLADIPANLLPSILSSLSLDLPVLGSALGQLSGGDQALLANVLDLLGVDEITDRNLTGLLALLGLDLSDPLNLSNLNVPGVNLVTAGPTFTALKLLGIDLGWVPSLPNSVAAEINGTPYLKLGVNGVVELVTGLLTKAATNNTLDLGLLNDLLGGLNLPLPGLGTTVQQAVAGLVQGLANIITPISGALPDIIDARVVPTVGIGAGAFAAALAYDKVIADLKNQPGGSAYTGVDPLLGSLTILPMILINNPARPDGGALARFGPLAALFGIDTVNPKTQLTGDGGLSVGSTGLHLGGANVLPVLIDATYEYQPLSDLASWPNAVSLLNNLAAGLSPTYMLRGLSLDGLVGQLTPQVTDALAGVTAGGPLALNLYATLQSKTLPLLEPLYLASDFLNLVGLGALAAIPMRIANAIAPALKILTDVGYSNVVRNPDGTYTRDFSAAGTETPFLSFPNVNPGQVIADTVSALFGGIQKELGPNPTPTTPNVLANLLGSVLGGGLLATPTTSPLAASDLPSTTARLTPLTPLTAAVEQEPAAQPLVGAAKGESKAEDAPAPASLGTTAAAVTTSSNDSNDTKTDTNIDTNTDVQPPKHAASDDVEAPAVVSPTLPKHAKDDGKDESKDGGKDDGKDGKDLPATPKKPALNVVRDSLDASPPKADKVGAKPGSDKAAEKGEPAGTATASDAAPSASQDSAA